MLFLMQVGIHKKCLLPSLLRPTQKPLTRAIGMKSEDGHFLTEFVKDKVMCTISISVMLFNMYWKYY
jgi:hypothetical protein